MTQPQDFKTSDLALSTFLKMSGLSLTGVSSVGKGRAVFIFGDTKDRPGLVLKFFSGDGRVDPAAYIQTFKQLKAAALGMQPDACGVGGSR